ncbi:MAG TPA: hypothetical protein VMV94_09410 [Phycisphaerae bacterium]|nr:hypothetical protein [Phycisphaerae bacterium]
MSGAAPLLPTDSPARCLGCRYPLRELTVNRCPECGREFDPGDPATMYLAPIPSPAERFLLQPPGWLFHIAAVVAGLIALLLAGLLLQSVALSMLAPCGAMILMVIWLLRLAAAIGLAWYHHDPVFSRLRTWRRWLSGPVLLLVLWVLLDLQVPLRLTFLLSQEAMDKLAGEVMQTPVGTKTLSSRRVGLYTAIRIERIEGGMKFLTREGGFAYSPDGPPPPGYPDTYMHFSGPWYVWVDRF